MSYTLEQFKRALKPCPRCGGREWMIESYPARKEMIVCATCCTCRFYANATRPGELARKLKAGIQLRYARGVPQWYRRLFCTKPMRAAERRFITKLKDDPDATEVESELSRRDKSFLWDYW